jgi:ribosomal-protein-alanine N-acetyltransferase
MLISSDKKRKCIFSLPTDRLFLCVLSPAAAPEAVEYLVRNRIFHKPYHQFHEDSYFTVSVQKMYLKSDINAYYSGSHFGFWIYLQSEPSRVIGRVSFSGIVRGALQSCLVGYHLDENETGKGYMTEALIKACQYMFDYHGLHRIQADIMPRNVRSINTIERCGFVRQGLSEKYMAINGKWEDHYSYALINDKFKNSEIIL